jgi:trk system potassium uptake protein TrkH
MEFFGSNPGRKAAIYFLSAILVGAVLLLLPISSSGSPIRIVDALFTSTSAVCVTGLIVLDTPVDFSLFGQYVILFLIQIGGIGIMTIMTGLLLSVGAGISLPERFGVHRSYDIKTGGDLKILLKSVVGLTLAFEVIGFILLFIGFRNRFPLSAALHHALFQSVSAFCNAGFSTFSNSLEDFHSDPYVILVVASLIITGGLGFVVLRELIGGVRRRRFSLSLHSRLCLTGTLILLVAGTLAFLVLEYDNLHQEMGSLDRTVNAFFQSVTARTAGFDTLPQRGLSEMSILVTMILMFIGACPGSTGGGIKVTTMVVIMLLVYQRFRGREHLTAFKRTISNDTIIRALTVLLLAFLVMVIMLGALMYSHNQPIRHIESRGWFVDNLFEVISALGTVGLSLGTTAILSTGGKIILTILMFTGRVGLLTLVMALANPPRSGELVYIEEEVIIG